MRNWLSKQIARFAGTIARGDVSSVVSAILKQQPGPKWSLDDTDSMYRKGYVENPVVRACVDLIADHAKSVPWSLKVDGADGWEEVTEEPPEELRHIPKMFNRVNERTTWTEHIEQTVVDRLVAGEYFWELVRPEDGPNAGRVIKMQTVRPTQVVVHPSDNARQPIESYEVTGGAGLYGGRGRVRLPPGQMLQGKYYDPRNFWRGLSPLASLARPTQRMNEYESWNVALAQNMGKAGGILNYNVRMNEEDAERVKDRYRAQHAGNPGDVMVTGELADYTETGISPTDADWIKGSDNAASLIMAVYNVPPEMLNRGNTTHENRKEARKVFYESAVIPVLETIATEWTRKLRTMYNREDIWVGPNTDNVAALQEDKDRKTQRVISQLQAGIITDTEAREALGMDREPEHGTRYIPATAIPEPAGSFGDASQPEEGEEAERALEALGLEPHYLQTN